jgi:hypothetical protein
MLHIITTITTKRNPAGEKKQAYAGSDVGEGNETKRIATNESRRNESRAELK